MSDGTSDDMLPVEGQDLADYIQQMADRLVAEAIAEGDARQPSDDAPSAEQQLQILRRREELRHAVTALGVRSRAIEFVTWRAAESFDLVDGRLVPRDGARHPLDPLLPLDIQTWLTRLQRDEPYLFESPRRH